MKLTRPLIFLALIFVSTFPAVAQVDTRISATWQVQKYDITANLPSTDSDRSLSVKADVTVKNVSASPASTLSLRISPNVTVTSASINGASADFTRREESIAALGTLQVIAIRVRAVAPASTLT